MHSCDFTGKGQDSKFRLDPDLLDEVVCYCGAAIECLSAVDIAPLSQSEADKARTWLEDDVVATSTQPPDDKGLSLMPFIFTSSKKCPNCPNRESHHHDHSCHHVVGGCGRYNTEYCSKCMATKEENINHRGSKEKCKCGVWMNIRSPLYTEADVQNFLVLKPYPFDKRCGCVIFNE
jgi:hypothetical protein